MANITRIKNNQITDSTITYAKIAPGTLVGSVFNPNLTFNSNITVIGNLSVQGNTSTVQSTNTYVNDPLIVFNNGYSGTPSYDIGVIANRNLQNLTGYGNYNTAWVWVESAGQWQAVVTTETGATTGAINNSGWGNIRVGNLVSIGSNVTGASLIGGTLSVTGATTLSSTLGVTGATTLTTANVGGLQATTIGNITPGSGAFTTLTTSGTVISGGNIVAGATTTSTSTTTGSFIAAGGAGIAGATWIGGLINVTGAATLQSTLGVTGATTLTTATAGGIQAQAIGNVTPGTGVFTTGTFNTATTGGLQAAQIGNVTPGAGTFTTISTGGLQALSIGNATPGTGAFTTLGATAATTLNTVTAASVQGIIGNVTPAAGTFTTLTATSMSLASLQVQQLGNVTPGVGAFTTLTSGSFQGIIGNATPAAGTFTSVTAQTETVGGLQAQAIGNVTPGTAVFTTANATSIQATAIGNITPGSGAFTTGTFSSTLGVTGATTMTTATAGGLQAQAIGNVTPGTAVFTTANASGIQATAIGNVTPGTAVFTTLTAQTETVGGLQATAIGNVTPGTAVFTTANAGGIQATAIGNITPGTGVFTTGTFNTVTTGGLQAVNIGNVTPGTAVFTTETVGGLQAVAIGNITPGTAVFTTANAGGIQATAIGNITPGSGAFTTGTFSSTLGVTGATTMTTATTGGLQAVAIGNVTPGTAVFTTETVGGLQAVAIGNVTPGTGVFTGLQATAIGNVTPGSAVFTTVTANTETVGGLQAVAIGNVTPGSAVFTSANATVANITGTTVSTTTTNGAFVVAGGVGVGGAMNVGGNLTVANIQTTGSGGNITGVNTLVASTGQFSNITVGGLQAVAIGNVTPSTAVFTTATATNINAVTLGNVGAKVTGDGGFLSNIIAGNIVGTVATANVSMYDSFTATTTNATFYPQIVDKTTGNGATYTSSSLSYNPSTGALSSTRFIGDGSQLTNVVGTNANVAYYDVITPLSNNQTYYLEFANLTNGNSITGAVSTVNVNPSTSTISALGFAGGTGAFTTLNATGVTQITNGTDSTSTGTGALQVTGGIGVLGNVWVGGNLYVANIIATTQSILTVSDPLLYLQAAGGGAPPYNYDIGLYSDYTAPNYRHTGVVRSFSSNTWTFFSNVLSEPSATTINWNDAGILYDSVKAGSLVLANATVATSTTTGALQVVGGVGIQGNLYAVGIQNTPIGNTTPSTGAFTTASTTGNLTVGGNIAITGNIVPSANITYSLGTSSNRFKDIWLSGQTEYIGGSVVGEDANGNLQLTAQNGNRISIVNTAANTIVMTGNVVTPYLIGNIIGTTGVITGLQATAIGNITPGTAVFTTANTGGLQAVAIGNITPGTATFTTTTTNTGTIGGLQAVAIGNVTPGTGVFVSVQATAIGNVTPGTAVFTTATTGGLQAVNIGNVTPGTAVFTTTTTNTGTIGGLQAVNIGNVTPGTAVFTTATTGGLQAVNIGNVTPGTAVFTTATTGGLQAVNIGNVTPGTAVFTTATTGGLQATAIGNVTPGTGVFVSAQATAIGNVTPGTGAFTTMTAGSFQGVIGNITPSTATFTTATTGGLQAVAIGNVTPGTGVFTGVQAQAIGNVTPGTAVFTTANAGGIQATAIGNITPGTGAFTTATATTVNAATIGNIGANVVGTGTYLTSLNAANINGTVATGNVSLYEQITNLTNTQTYYVPFANVTSGNSTLGAVTTVNVNPSTGNVSAPYFVGSGAYLTNINIGALSGTFPTSNVSVYQQLTNSTTNATFYLPFYDKATGNAQPYTNTSLNFTPSTGYLYATGASIATVIATTVSTSSTIIAGGNIVAGSGVASTNSVTGALISTGGLGVAGNINAGVNGTSVHSFAGNVLIGQGVANATYADTILTINENNSVPVVGHGYNVHLSGLASRNAVYGADSFGTGTMSAFSGRHARGTATAPSAVQNGDFIGGLYFKGYGTTGYSSTAAGSTAGITLVAKENFTDSAQGTAIILQTIPTGSTSAQTAVYIGTDGNVVANSVTPSTSTTTGALVVAGGTGIAGNLWVGANTNVSGNLTVTNSITGLSALQVTGNISTLSTADTTAPGRGSFNTPGGASIGGNLYVGNDLFVGPAAFNTTLTSPTIFAVDQGSSYAQIAILNNAASGSSDFISYAANYAGSSNDHGWSDMGFTGNAFNDANYTITKSLDAYLFGSGAGGVGGNLVLATDYTGSHNDIVIGVGSFSANSEVARFHGNVSNNGTFILKLPTNAVPAANTGAFQVWGGESISGNSYVGGAMTINGSQTANYDFKVHGVNTTNLIWARPSSTYDGVTIGNTTTVGSLVNGAKLAINSTDSILIPTGTSAQRPSGFGFSDVQGMFRYNTTLGAIEWYTGTTWNTASTQFTVITSEQFNGDGTTVDFTLGGSITTAGTIVSINGVMQIPTLAYTITGAGNNVLTFTEAPTTGDVIDVRRLTTTQTLFGILSQNGQNAFQTDNYGSYVYSGTGSGSTVSAGYDNNGTRYTSKANVTVTSANVATTVFTFDNTVYRSGKLVIQATKGTTYQAMEALVVQDGTTATVMAYGTIYTAGNLGVVTATISGSNTLVQFIANSASTIVRTSTDMLVI